MCMYIYIYIYIVYEISKGSNMFTKTCFKIYLDKKKFGKCIFLYICLILFLSKHLKIYLFLYVFQSKKINVHVT